MLPVTLTSDYMSRIKELHRGKNTSNQPSVDGLLCTQSKQYQLCYALFDLSIDHKKTLQMCKWLICNREKVSWAEKLLFIQCQLNGPAASEPCCECALVCSQHKSFMNAFAFKYMFPFLKKQAKELHVVWPYRCECTIRMGMENLCYCAPWHDEHHLFKKFSYGLTQRM